MIARFSLFLILCFSLWSVVACGNPASAIPPIELTLRAQDIKFDVTTLKVKVHQPVKLTYINQGTIDHAFAIAGLVKDAVQFGRLVGAEVEARLHFSKVFLAVFFRAMWPCSAGAYGSRSIKMQ